MYWPNLNLSEHRIIDKRVCSESIQSTVKVDNGADLVEKCVLVRLLYFLCTVIKKV